MLRYPVQYKVCLFRLAQHPYILYGSNNGYVPFPFKSLLLQVSNSLSWNYYYYFDYYYYYYYGRWLICNQSCLLITFYSDIFLIVKIWVVFSVKVFFSRPIIVVGLCACRLLILVQITQVALFLLFVCVYVCFVFFFACAYFIIDLLTVK
jgi:hypothetical protein